MAAANNIMTVHLRHCWEISRPVLSPLGQNWQWLLTSKVGIISYCCLLSKGLKATMFFLCFRWARALDIGSALPKKNCPARALDCKFNKFISRDKKIFFQLCLFTCFFVALINFSRTLSNVFFISSPSFPFPKICAMFFFLNCFFYRPPSSDFGFFSDLKQRN